MTWLSWPEWHAEVKRLAGTGAYRNIDTDVTAPHWDDFWRSRFEKGEGPEQAMADLDHLSRR